MNWSELTKNIQIPFAQQVSNISITSFGDIDQTFGEFRGLIYDGAFSEHIENMEKKGLTGEDISKEKAREIAVKFIGESRTEEIIYNGLIENGTIASYDFSAKVKNGDTQNLLNILISKKGGHIVSMNYNREIKVEVINHEDADKIGREFLISRGINNMETTYYIKQGGAITINYAYKQNDVIVYSDLIKLKIALDDGEVLGIETRGYLNNHHTREHLKPEISAQKAKERLNKNLEITEERLAIIPTKWKTEVFCYEFKGKINNMNFLVYINALTGKEEDILLIIDAPNGILAQ